MTRHAPLNWIAVASAEHVQRGREGGFMQVCHGKAAPLRRVHPNDCVIYYSPTQTFGGRDKLQALTAIGIVAAGDGYQVDMGEGFCPFRRNVTWLDARVAAIAPLLDVLELTAGKRNWGGAFRFGLRAISEADVAVIATAMGVRASAWRCATVA
jgi:hypothetical protein